MREIKFRAWDKKEKYWMGNFRIMPNGTLQHNEQSKRNPAKLEWIEVNGQNIEIMQFTGLKDKNGKEIYEGDILLSKMFDIRIHEWVNRICLVLPFDKGFLQVRGIENKFWEPLLGNIIGDSWNIEVIGNKFENPELLR